MNKKLRDVRYIVIHCSATPPDMDIGAAEIDRWHRAKGFFKIGYHAVIRRNGLVESGRALDEVGAHAVGFNEWSLGICLVGGVERVPDRDGLNDADGPNWDLPATNNFTVEQFGSLLVVVRRLKRTHPRALVTGHRDLPKVNKECPSFDVRTWAKKNGVG